MDIHTRLGAWHKRATLASWTAGLVQDIKLGWRRSIRAPGFSAVAVAVVAIAVGGNTALFGVIEALILRPLPYAEPEELVDIRLNDPGHNLGVFSYPVFRELEDATKEVFADMSGSMMNRVHLSDGAELHDNPFNELVAGPYFQVLGVDAQVGRVLDPSAGAVAGADPVVVLSDEYWRRTFAGDPGVVGRTVWLNGFPYTIVGVAARGFGGVVRGIKSALWSHASMADQISLLGAGSLEKREFDSFMVIGRLADGMPLADAREVVAAFAEHLFAAYPGIYRDHRIEVTPTLASAVHPLFDETIVPVATLATSVLALLLLLACLNLASILVARAERRRHEFAVFLALGAGRGRLVRSLLTESTMLALFGGAAGVYLSVFLMRVITSIRLPVSLPISIDARLNAPVFLFALGLALLAGLLVGMGPALQFTRPGISDILKGKRAGGTRGSAWVRSVLLAIQVATTAMLIVAAGALLRSWFSAHQVDPGFGRHPAVIASLAPGSGRSVDEHRAFYDAYLQKVTNIPGVVSAGSTTAIPLQLSSRATLRLWIPGVDPPPGETSHLVDWGVVGGDYFAVMGIPMLAGRLFDSRDDARSGTVTIVSETMAEHFWPDQDPLGRELAFCADCGRATVVGVAGDTRVRSLSEPPRPFVYTAMAQSPYVRGTVVARTSGNPAQVLPAMLALANEMDPQVVTLDAKTMDQHLSFTLIPARITAVLFGAIGIFALLLAAIGVYGIVGYTVAARQRELAIRMALGVTPWRLVSSVLWSTMKLISAGLVSGLLLAVAAAHLPWSPPHAIRELDPIDLVGTAVLLSTVGLLAAYLSVRRAIRLDVVHALKEG